MKINSYEDEKGVEIKNNEKDLPEEINKTIYPEEVNKRIYRRKPINDDTTIVTYIQVIVGFCVFILMVWALLNPSVKYHDPNDDSWPEDRDIRYGG